MSSVEQLLQPALGYLQLGMPQEANDEIEALPPELKTSRQVLSIRASIYMESGAWQLMREVSGFLVKQWPEESQHWIWLGWATRRCRSIMEAELILLDALRFHDSEAMIHFNLACYSAQTSNLKQALMRLARAIELDADIRIMALEDQDLEPLWMSLGDGSTNPLP